MSLQSAPVFYFGDSLTDVGVVFDALVGALTAQILPGLIADLGANPTPEDIALAQQQAAFLAEQQATIEAQALGFGPENAVTNEFTHATYFGEISGAIVANFANAGARALGVQEPFGPGTGYDSNLGGQLDRFIAATTGMDLSATHSVIFIGSNDFSDIVGGAISDPDSSIFDVIGAAAGAVSDLLDVLEDAARTLDSAGVGTVYFGTLPGATFFPSAAALDDFSAGLSDLVLAGYNVLLEATAQSLQDEGIDVQIIDYAAVANAISNDPSSFGILAAADDFLIDGSVFDSDQVGFWDPIHPAEAAHQAWGAYTSFVMEGGSTSSLSDFGTLSVQDGGDNAVFANGGDDTVVALNGDDIVFAGTGADLVFAGRGDDIVSGGSGDDVLRGQGGDDIVSGGNGDDTVSGGLGDDVLIDGLGSDVLQGNRGDDTFVFVQSSLLGDPVQTGDIVRGGSGTDTLYLVLDDATFDSFGTDGAAATLAALGISINSVETIIAIDGTGQVEDVLGGETWFEDADFWGLIPAPSDPLIV